jgi:hypothetical protein
MANVHRVQDLDLSDDMAFQRWEWRVQRVAWVLMVCGVLMAVAGVFGGGPLAYASTGERGSEVWAEYSRFARLNATADLRIHVTPKGDRADLWISRDYHDRVRLEQIVPEPQAATVSADRIIYSFKTQPGAAVTVTFHLKTESAGRLHGHAGVVGGAGIAWSSFVYP